MKILHICLGCFYIDNYSYQENMLPKFHKELGYEVEIIASTVSFDDTGKACNVAPRKYTNEYGIPVTRLEYAKMLPNSVGKFLRIYSEFYKTLNMAKPDIIFVHGCQFLDIRYIVKYAKNNGVRIYVDNHADFSNSARNWLSRNILHRGIWKFCAQLILPYTKKFYGVLPARVEFLKKVYKIPENKVELLVMGADDSLVKKYSAIENKNAFRKAYNIADNEFLIVTGGKIDNEKWQVINLINAVKNLNEKKIKLIIFGTIVENMKKRILSSCNDEQIRYIGWLGNEDVYKCLAASNLAIYPGRHSVLWEQTVGLGIPLVVKYWEGTTHIDMQGNVVFIFNDTEEELKEKIMKVCEPRTYKKMIGSSQKNATKFWYSSIAKRSIEYPLEL